MKNSTVHLYLGVIALIGAMVTTIRQGSEVGRWGATIMAVVILIGAQILHAIEKREK